MNYFSYPITIVQINIFEEPQIIFSQPKPRPQNIEPAPSPPPPPRIFNYRVPPLGFEMHVIDSLNYSLLIPILIGYPDGHSPSSYDLLSSPYCFLNKADFKKRFS